MLLYFVQWSVDNKLTKGKGRTKNDDVNFMFTCLCRNSANALECAYHYFHHSFNNTSNLTFDDGIINLKRCVVDSRGFSANFLMLDGMREPINLTDIKSSLIRLSRFYH